MYLCMLMSCESIAPCINYIIGLRMNVKIAIAIYSYVANYYVLYDNRNRLSHPYEPIKVSHDCYSRHAGAKSICYSYI